ncbi:MAG TPA: aldehyde dehydrogenase family protein, partial [Candidatus Aminicenantes bacterium]|nr:aldehyde dehydrogenase family protein [Candidatus Aminicenantes bacterium]
MPAEVIPMETSPAGLGRQAILRRFPLGPVAAITPFNFPLNQVAHKLAPAIAAGCPLVLKPASQTPLSALMLAEIARESGLPGGGLSLLPLAADLAAPLAEDERFRLFTFTGSAEVGWELKRRAGHKRVALELGGNAGVIVHHDAEIDYAAERCTQGGFTFSGQSCISVQRIFVHASVLDRFLDAFLPRVAALKVGHPLDETSDLCSLISEKDGNRMAGWLTKARREGATVLAGGEIAGAVMRPTVVTGAAAALEISCREVFAPLVTVTPYDDFSSALKMVNDSPYGLQAGVF